MPKAKLLRKETSRYFKTRMGETWAGSWARRPGQKKCQLWIKKSRPKVARLRFPKNRQPRNRLSGSPRRKRRSPSQILRQLSITLLKVSTILLLWMIKNLQRKTCHSTEKTLSCQISSHQDFWTWPLTNAWTFSRFRPRTWWKRSLVSSASTDNQPWSQVTIREKCFWTSRQSKSILILL